MEVGNGRSGRGEQRPGRHSTAVPPEACADSQEADVFSHRGSRSDDSLDGRAREGSFAMLWYLIDR